MRPKPKKYKITTLNAMSEQSSKYYSDVLGSYTGTSADADNPSPDQDADDL